MPTKLFEVVPYEEHRHNDPNTADYYGLTETTWNDTQQYSWPNPDVVLKEVTEKCYYTDPEFIAGTLWWTAGCDDLAIGVDESSSSEMIFCTFCRREIELGERQEDMEEDE
jgi:hypothetical protein